MKTLFGRCLMLLALTSLVACNGESQVGSIHVATKEIKAGAGGTLAVTTQESAELAGTNLFVPPEALAQDTQITVGLDREPIVAAAEAAGPVADFGPSGTTFASPATLVLPYRLSASQKPGNLYVRALEDDGTQSTLDGAKLTIDAAQGLVSFQVSHFTRFQAGARPDCSSNSACPAGQVCVAGQCSACAAAEICSNGLDDDCDGVVDNGCGAACSAEISCPAGQVCVSGTCQPGCTGGTWCNSACVDLTGDELNCGACGVACAAGQTCVGAVCLQQGCATNADCEADEQCRDGQCGRVCPSSCANPPGPCWATGGYISDWATCACTYPPLAAGSACDDGDPATSADHCDGAGQCLGSTACSSNQGCPAGEQCVRGTCVPIAEICGNGLDDDGDGLVDEGCAEPCSTNVACPAGSACVSGFCQPLSEICDNAIDDDGDGMLDCTDTDCSAASECWLCVSNADCGSDRLCIDGTCQVSCAAGQTLCVDHCVDLQSDLLHCGGCDIACIAGQACNAGVCGVASCRADTDCAAGQHCIGGVCR
ncbi:MAG: hypothetical protein HY901_32715 [Deltaproteobacteria bacterium]|nr:hypothetical protein [Deltaproteobacteria bacterium]